MFSWITPFILGVCTGLYAGNSTIRHRVNAMLVRIWYSLLELASEGTAKRKAKAKVTTVKTEQPKTAQPTEKIQTVKGMYPCTCGGVLEPVKDWPKYYACVKCNTLKQVG